MRRSNADIRRICRNGAWKHNDGCLKGDDCTLCEQTCPGVRMITRCPNTVRIPCSRRRPLWSSQSMLIPATPWPVAHPSSRSQDRVPLPYARRCKMRRRLQRQRINAPIEIDCCTRMASFRWRASNSQIWRRRSPAVNSQARAAWWATLNSTRGPVCCCGRREPALLKAEWLKRSTI